MRTVDLIHRKRDGEELSAEELSFLVKSYTQGEIPDYQMSAFLMATFFSGMTDREVSSLTDCIIASGERVDLSDIPGEVTSKTQPIPLKPPSFASQTYEPSDVTPEAFEQFSRMSKDWKIGGLYTPPSKQGTLMYPGTVGGGLWGGSAWDPKSGVMYVNAQSLPSMMQLLDAPPNSPYPYMMGGIRKLRDDKGNPGVKPPWGTLTAINLTKGDFVWQKVLGKNKTTEKNVGTENFGGPIVTAGGLVFIGATSDEMLRAFDAPSGEILWATKLPAGGYAPPATYSGNG